MPANNPAASGPSTNKTPSRASASRQGGRLSADSIGWYLSNIGRVPLLTPAEEIELAHHVQAMKRLQELPEAELTARQKHQIRMGTRARDRMMAANL
ncbi:MAG: sigma-70 factor domain-containing protein, partial [Vulcanococcus sp.]